MATMTTTCSVAANCEQYLQQMSRLGVLSGDFYLLLGAAYAGQPLPPEFRLGPERHCYMNAGRLAADSAELVYCEGFALRAGLFPMHHAWCIDSAGKVIDPTWEYDPDNEYFGVALSTDFLLGTTVDKGVWGLLREHLPDSVVRRQPAEYLHPCRLPPTENMDLFWEKLQRALGSNQECEQAQSD